MLRSQKILASRAQAALLLGSLHLAAGCEAPPAYREADFFYFQNRPRDVLTRYAPAEEDRSANALVGIDKMLSAAILAGDWGEAERLANLASTRVNIFLAGEKGERDALSLLGQEKNKPFKGEPHERAMADFYLGLLRFRRGDHEGALNGFLSAMYKDRGIFLMPVEKEKARRGAKNTETFIYSDDYALFAFCAAKSCQLIDEPGEAARYLQKAKEIRPDLAEIFDRGMNPASNVLALIEAGRAPEKTQTGRRGEILGYRRIPGGNLDAILLGGQPLSFALTEELFVQATTLGGRAVDELNKSKAIRQEVLQTAGFFATAAGSMIATSSRDRDTQVAGLIVASAGLAAMIFAGAAIDPSADVRSWSTLLDQIYLAVGEAPPGKYEVEIRARNQGGGDLSQRWTDVPVSGETTLLWFRLLESRKGGVYPAEGQNATTITMENTSGKES